MRYAQITNGRKLHLVYEVGEGFDQGYQLKRGELSAPLCRHARFQGRYRMTINFPLGRACKRCLKVWQSRYSEE